MNIVGKLKVDVTIDGKTFKAGETVSFPEQLGLEDFIETGSKEKTYDAGEKGGKK